MNSTSPPKSLLTRAEDDLDTAVAAASPQLVADLDDALLNSGVDLTPKLLKDILWAVGASRITEQQFSVLRLALSGLSDKEIADQLKIHARTLEFHWNEIRRRLGIQSRLQIGAFIVASTCGNPQVVKFQDPAKVHGNGKLPQLKK